MEQQQSRSSQSRSSSDSHSTSKPKPRRRHKQAKINTRQPKITTKQPQVTIKLESNTKIATIMDNLQYKSKHEEHNCFSTLTKPTELADFCLKIMEDHLQIRIKRNIEAWQDQKGTVDSSPTTIIQNRNRRLSPSQQTTEQQIQRVVCYPTLRALERLA